MYLQSEITLKDKGIILGTVPSAIADLQLNQTKNFEILEDVIFIIRFREFCLFGRQGQPLNSVQPISITQEVGLPVDKYRRLLSKYYRNIA